MNRVWTELERIKEQKKQLAIREVQLNESVRALLPLVGAWQVNVNEYSLSNAVRFIFNSLEPGSGRGLTAMEVRSKLEDLGYDLTKYENPLASIHTCVRRMIETEELNLMESSEDEKKKKFEPGPELKPVPEVSDGKLGMLSQLWKISEADQGKK